MEFELQNYNSAVKNLPHWSKEDTTPTEITPPVIKTEAPAEQTTETLPKQPEQPRRERVSRELKNLESGLDGPSWECKEMHGRHLRVKTTGIEDEDEFKDSWDNTQPIQDPEHPAERLDKRD